MKRFGYFAAALAVAAFVNPVLAQNKRASPHETTSATIDGAKVDVTYGRPFKKGRDVWGTAVTEAPSKDAWRMGADEATLLKTSTPLQFGTLSVPAGEYSLFLSKGAGNAAQLIVNKQTGQWGMSYDKAQDLGRVDLKMEKASAPAEQFTIAVEPGKPSGGVLKITWDDRTYSAPFTVQK